MNSQIPVLAVVGPCAAGKSTLIAALEDHGYQARHVAQEHSFVPDMWQRLAAPEVLIYLDVSYRVAAQRTSGSWQESIHEKQIQRLSHARDHADVYIKTDDLKPAEVLAEVLDYLEKDPDG